MDKPFIRIGRFYLNVNQIGYVTAGSDHIRIVTAIPRQDGKGTFAVKLSGVAAQAVRAALEPLVSFDEETGDVSE